MDKRTILRGSSKPRPRGRRVGRRSLVDKTACLRLTCGRFCVRGERRPHLEQFVACRRGGRRLELIILDGQRGGQKRGKLSRVRLIQGITLSEFVKSRGVRGAEALAENVHLGQVLRCARCLRPTRPHPGGDAWCRLPERDKRGTRPEHPDQYRTEIPARRGPLEASYLRETRNELVVPAGCRGPVIVPAMRKQDHVGGADCGVHEMVQRERAHADTVLVERDHVERDRCPILAGQNLPRASFQTVSHLPPRA